MEATLFYGKKADDAFAKYDDACILYGEKSEEAQIALRQYQSAMIQYNAAVALDDAAAHAADEEYNHV